MGRLVRRQRWYTDHGITFELSDTRQEAFERSRSAERTSGTTGRRAHHLLQGITEITESRAIAGGNGRRARAEAATITDERSAASGSAIAAGNARGLRRKDPGNARDETGETTRVTQAGGRRRTRAITRARRRPPSAHRDPTATVRNQRRPPETQHAPSERPK